MSSPDVLDAEALHQERLQRWGPSGPCHIFIPPRPHLQSWVDRLLLQVEVEDAKSVFSLCCVVPRDGCPAQLDAEAIHQLVPQARGLLEDARLSVRALAVAERPELIRVPADERALPPGKWESAFLPRNKVLLVLCFRRRAGGAVPLSGAWLRGSLPDPEPSGLELLRVEYTLPPAVRQKAAAKEAMKALRKLAEVMGIPFSLGHQLRQVQTTHGGLVALLAVPRPEALQWLRGSGCGGLFVRPFWTRDTSPTLSRDQFQLLWLRGHLADAPRLWEAVHGLPGV